MLYCSRTQIAGEEGLRDFKTGEASSLVSDISLQVILLTGDHGARSRHVEVLAVHADTDSLQPCEEAAAPATPQGHHVLAVQVQPR